MYSNSSFAILLKGSVAKNLVYQRSQSFCLMGHFMHSVKVYDVTKTLFSLNFFIVHPNFSTFDKLARMEARDCSSITFLLYAFPWGGRIPSSLSQR